MNTATHLVFVYGTLKRGQSNHPRLTGQTFVDTGTTRDPDFAMYHNGWYPMVIRSDDRQAATIAGEIWQVDDSGLASLDQLEGNGRLYQREEIAIQCDNGSTITAWMYLYLPPIGGESIVIRRGNHPYHWS